jgi:DNA end-binding protein Ku
MARAFWKGVISFGMVAIPVSMYVATESKTPAFHLLHKKCLTRPKQVLRCETDNEYFSTADTVRGYEYTEGQYVVLTEQDFEKVPVGTTHSIDIDSFVDASEIDPVYYHSSHYLEPEKLGIKPFHLLHEALVKTKRVGIARVTFQRREHLCCLRPVDNGLALHTLYYHEEILPRLEPVATKTEAKPEEIDLALSLVKAMAKSFHPSEYEDRYRLELEKIIEAKIRGEEIVTPKVSKPVIPDLMAALRASVDAASKKPSAGKTGSAKVKVKK